MNRVSILTTNAGAARFEALLHDDTVRQALLDRVLALHSRDRGRGSQQINVAGEQTRWHGRPIPLRPNQFRALHLMAENPNRVLSRQADRRAPARPAIRSTCARGSSGCASACEPRARLGALRTVDGKGYVLDPPRTK